MDLSEYEVSITKWGWTRPTVSTDRIRVGLSGGASMFFDGYELRSDFGGIRVGGEYLCRLNKRLSNQRLVAGIRMDTHGMLSQYGNRRWQRQHKLGSKRLSDWIDENIEFVIWPERRSDIETAGQLIYGHPLLVSPMLDERPLWTPPGNDSSTGAITVEEPFGDMGRAYTRPVVTSVTHINAPQDASV